MSTKVFTGAKATITINGQTIAYFGDVTIDSNHLRTPFENLVRVLVKLRVHKPPKIMAPPPSHRAQYISISMVGGGGGGSGKQP